MIFRTYFPGYPLRSYVHHLFYFEGFMPVHRVDRFLPDGNTEIIIDLTDEPKYIYDNDTLAEIQSCRNAWVSGMRTQPITIPSGQNHKMLIISFHKGRSFPFYPLPADELTDQVVDAELIYGSAILELRNRLTEEPDIDRRFVLVEQFLCQLAGDSLEQDTVTQCMQYAVQRLVHSPGEVMMQHLSERIGYSQKHFVSLFKKHVGITPKRYMRILRFQQAVTAIEGLAQPEWSHLALDCGFYDQAHFANEFKRFSGFSPGEYLRRKSDTLNYIPIG
ncbi:MAG: AraC family transcriptional regulator [Saprospiraceae bacterium]|nr:AraC family transcriptional regulator [Saprospiraceae bacterium]